MKRLILPYPPQMNHLYTIARGRKILSSKGRSYKEEVRLLCLGHTPSSATIAVTLWVFRPRKSGDLDNVFKVVLDSLTGSLWHDDRQIVEIHAYRCDDKANPRVELEVAEIQINNNG